MANNMACGLLKLPNELLVQIFDILRDDRAQGKLTIRAWMMCCRRMYFFALPLFYQHISVDMDKSQLLLNALRLHSPKSRRAPMTTESLTVWLPIVQGPRVTRKKNMMNTGRPTKFSFMEITQLKKVMTTLSLSTKPFQKLPLNPIRDLVEVIKKMDQLTMFSLSSNPFGKVKILPSAHRDVALLVNALPSTVVSLELDLGCSDKQYAKESNIHVMPYPYCPLCGAIRNRIPKLEHLRLRMTYLCTGLFRSLQYIMPPEIKHLPLCSLTIWTAVTESRTTYPCQPWITNDIYGRSIMNDARDLYVSGGIPNIRYFVIMGINMIRHNLMKYDLITDTLTVCPYSRVFRPGNYTLFPPRNLCNNSQSPEPRLPPPVQWEECLHLRALKLPSANGSEALNYEYIGPYHGLLQLVEGDDAWVPSTYGPRFPDRSRCLQARMRVYQCFHDAHSFIEQFSESSDFNFCPRYHSRQPEIKLNTPIDFSF